MLAVIARTESKSERIIVYQHGSDIEVIKVLDNFVVFFTSKNLTSSLTLENIFERVSNHRKVRQPFQRQNQKKNKSGE